MRVFMKSAYHAFSGIHQALKEERHMRIHVAMAFLVFILGAIVSLTRMEWAVILLVIGNVICLELVNTAIERAVGFTSTEQHPLAKAAKDIAAGAVLLSAIVAVIIGLIIFMPKIINIIF